VAALAGILLTLLVVAAPTAWWWRSQAVVTTPVAHLVGARVLDWRSADQDVGPLQTLRIFHRLLPASFAGSPESRLPAGVVPIVSYRVATTNVAAYVRSVNRRLIIIFQYNPEARMSAADFTSVFERQADVIHAARNPDVQVAMSAEVGQYQPNVNAPAASCAYIPPRSYVDYYLAALYEPYLLGITRTDGGGFVTWQHCTSGLDRPRGLVEYGLGLGTRGSSACQPESARTSVMRADMEYLHDHLPDLAILEYWWATTLANPPCSRSWKFAAGSSTGQLWRAITNRTLDLSAGPTRRGAAPARRP